MTEGSRWSPLLGVFDRERARLARRLAQHAGDREVLAALLRAEFVDVPPSIVHGRLQLLALHLVQALDEGARLSQAMAEHPGDFRGWEIELVRVAERCGESRAVLEAWTRRLSAAALAKDALSNALVYPVALLLTTAACWLLMLGQAIPTLAMIYTGLGVALPWLTRVFIQAANLLADAMGFAALSLVVLLGVAAVLRSGERGRLLLATLRYRLPWIGPALLRADRALACEQLGALAAAGVDAAEAVDLTARALPSLLARRELSSLAGRLRDGGTTEGSRQGLFLPSSLQRRLVAAWSSDRADQRLASIAAAEASRGRRRLLSSVGVLEPVAVVLIGAACGLALFAAFQPVYELGGHVVASIP